MTVRGEGWGESNKKACRILFLFPGKSRAFLPPVMKLRFARALKERVRCLVPEGAIIPTKRIASI